MLIVTWIVYFYNFYEVYGWAEFFTRSDASALVKVVYIFTYYGDKLVPYAVVGFLLLNLNVLLALVIQLINERQAHVNAILVWMAIGVFIIASGIFILTAIWPLMLLLIIVSLVIGYTLYIVYTKANAEDIEYYENNEMIKEAGPFTNEKDATDFSGKFCHEWEETFARRNLSLVTKIYHGEGNAYHVQIHVKHE